MDLEALEKLIAGGESEQLEMKHSTAQLTSACQSLCGILNNRGGAVVFGVDSGGRILGQNVSDDTLRRIGSELQKFEPYPPVELLRVPLHSSHLEAIVLYTRGEPNSRPFVFDGRPYHRVGTTTQRMPQDRYESMLLHRAHSASRWENAPVRGMVTQLLDLEELNRTIRTGNESGRIPVMSMEEPEIVLERLGLYRDQQLLNAALVLFGRIDPADYPQCHLRLARFRGVDKQEFVDSQQVFGNVFELLDAALNFALRHLPIAGRVQPGLFQRRDDPIVPVEALREAVVNAVCHRDYSIAGGAVSLAVFDDRMEVWSDGELPESLTVDDLKREHPSRPRNPLIADVLYKRGLIERWGRGTQRIIELCRDAGQLDPQFEERAGAVGVIFNTDVRQQSARLTERQRELLRIVRGDDGIALRDIMRRLEEPPSSRTVQADLARLREAGLVTVVGRGRGALYRKVPSVWE